MELRLDYPAEKWRNVYKVGWGVTCIIWYTLVRAACVPDDSKMHITSKGSLVMCFQPAQAQADQTAAL